MANRKYRNRAQQRQENVPISKAGPIHRRAWLWVVIVLIVVGAAIIAAKFAVKSNDQARLSQSTVNSDINPSPEPTWPDTAWDPSWSSLPTLGEPARPIEVVRAAYAYAVRRENVLRYMPCYCGCERQGHRSNHDCFVRGKSAAGAPAWDPMGYT